MFNSYPVSTITRVSTAAAKAQRAICMALAALMVTATLAAAGVTANHAYIDAYIAARS